MNLKLCNPMERKTMKLSLKKDWCILQDVHDTAEGLGIYKGDFVNTGAGAQISEWEALPELKQLQLLFAKTPYFGRELRYFNEAPWWYRNQFTVPEGAGKHCRLTFTNADYYCKVWLNGHYVGEHEGYSAAFDFPVDAYINRAGSNNLVVKVWSPWDTEVEKDLVGGRTFLVRRKLVKGTYEHSDTLFQRDVNPVGLYGDVFIEFAEDAFFVKKPVIGYDLNETLTEARLKISAEISGVEPDGQYAFRVRCIDRLTKNVCGSGECAVSADGEVQIEARVEDITPWNTWDRGYPYLYEIEVSLVKDGRRVAAFKEMTGFRKIEMIRDVGETSFILNGEKWFVRGTSYFPDQYVSAMNEERYRRDLLAIKTAGFNLLRIHVHIEFPLFYELCDELGIGIIQDSEYNWTHPFDTDFSDRFIAIFTENISQMTYHPSIFAWICMNEPGVMDMVSASMAEELLSSTGNSKKKEKEVPVDLSAGLENSYAMKVHPGPAILEAVKKADPTRPLILGSFCAYDPNSGDSHNYKGSLNGENTHYLDLYGTKEKLNTEYGFDALPAADSLKKTPEVYKRLKVLEDDVQDIQGYQYKYLKYVTEHYRLQKYTPCSGYVHFLFNDTSPVSFYGILDWFGLPKAGLTAMLESNMPICVMVKFGPETIDGICVANDNLAALGECQIEWTVRYKDGESFKGQVILNIDGDSLTPVCALGISKVEQEFVDIYLVMKKDGEIIATNHYEDIFHQPPHVRCHPSRISHELGCRIYWA